jgi:uncharacterized DUF497 family protein
VARYSDIWWSERKAAANLSKHGVSFEEARDTLDDPFTRTMHDYRHSDAENRYVGIGYSNEQRILFIAYSIYKDVARLISARSATPAEKRSYMSGKDIIRDAPMEDDYDPADYEWDFSNAKPIGDMFAKLRGSVVLDSDVCDVFRSADEVNNALRMLIREGRVPHLNYPPQ